jgi:hypothetical protein
MGDLAPMAEQLLEEIPGIKQEDNRLVSRLTGDPNPVHDEQYMKCIEYNGRVYRKKPLIMGIISETIAKNAIRGRFGKNLYLHNLLTDFKGFLYPNEPVSICLIDTNAELPAEFEGDEVYTAVLRKKGMDFAVVTLGFTEREIELPEEANGQAVEYLSIGDVARFSRATNQEESDVQGLLLASRSRIVASNLQNPEYPQLARLSNPDLFPVYARHQAVFSRHMSSVCAEDLVGMSLAARLEDKKRPEVYTTINASSSGQILFRSQSHIITISRNVALGKFIEDL